MSDEPVTRMVWTESLEPGSVLRWTFMRPPDFSVREEWVTVLSARKEGSTVYAIVVRENGEQDWISQDGHVPVRVKVEALS